LLRGRQNQNRQVSKKKFQELNITISSSPLYPQNSFKTLLKNRQICLINIFDSAPGDFYQHQQQLQNATYQNLMQYNYNQPPVDNMGGSHSYQRSYQPVIPQQPPQYVNYNQQQNFQQPTYNVVEPPEAWNISQSKSSYVVSIYDSCDAPVKGPTGR
jgi:hypothetical protein